MNTSEISDNRSCDSLVVSEALEAASLALIIVSALVTNATAISIILRVRSLRRNPHNLLLLNLAFADFCQVFGSMIPTMISIFDCGHLLRSNRILCSVNGFFSNLFAFAAFVTIALISVDRALIVRATRKHSTKHRSRIYFMISLAWMIGVLISLLPTLKAVSTMAYFHAIRHCTIKTEGKRIRILFGLLSFFVYPLTMIICYSVITYSLGKQKKKLQHGRKHSHAISKNDITKGQPSTHSVSVWRSEFLSDSKEKQSVNGHEELDSHDSKTGTKLKQEISPTVTCNVQGSSPGVNDTSVHYKGTHTRKCLHCDDESENTSSHSCKVQEDGPPKVIPEEGKDAKEHKMVLPDASTCSEHTNCDRVDPKLTVGCRAKKAKKHYDAQKRVTLIGALLIVSLLVCWSPYLLFRSLDEDNIVFGVISMWLAYCITIVDPLIYTFLNRRARRELKRKWRTVLNKLQFK